MPALPKEIARTLFGQIDTTKGNARQPWGGIIIKKSIPNWDGSQFKANRGHRAKYVPL